MQNTPFQKSMLKTTTEDILVRLTCCLFFRIQSPRFSTMLDSSHMECELGQASSNHIQSCFWHEIRWSLAWCRAVLQMGIRMRRNCKMPDLIGSPKQLACKCKWYMGCTYCCSTVHADSWMAYHSNDRSCVMIKVGLYIGQQSILHGPRASREAPAGQIEVWMFLLTRVACRKLCLLSKQMLTHVLRLTKAISRWFPQKTCLEKSVES